MADIQLLDLRNRRDWTHVRHGQSMARVHREPEAGTEARRVLQRRERLRITVAVRVLSRVQLDRRGAQVARTLDRVALGRDKETRANTGGVELGDAFA